jgi:hypothetical protein
MRALVRTLSVLAAVGGYAVVASILFDDASGDANIGVGLLLFALLASGVTAWAFIDGLRAEGFLTALLPWCLVAIALGVAVPVAVAVAEGLRSRVLLEDLMGTVPFMLVLVLAPASLAVAVGRGIASSRRSGPG